MIKYIVKDCPAIDNPNRLNTTCVETLFKEKCCNITDCKIKQIITLCKADAEITKYVTGRKTPPALNQRILQILEIEEVTNK